MSKYRIIRVVELLFFLLFAYIAWCLAYEITVAARYAPTRFPGEGATRFALLKQQQVFAVPDVFVLAPKHLIARLSYPGTQMEAVLRGLIAFAGMAALGLGLVILRLATRPPKPFGDARIGTLRDASKARLLNDDGIVLGRFNGVPLRVGGQGHILIVGPTRSGKGVGFVLPNLFEHEGSALVLDWKEENFANSAMRREAMGHKVYKFAPGQAESHRYNPLDFVRRDASMPTDCDTIALFIIKSTEREDIWPKAARQLVSGLIGYVLTSERTNEERHLRSVQRMMVTGQDLSDVLKTIIETEGATIPQWVKDRFRQFMAVPEKTRGSIIFNLNDSLNIWSNELISSVTQTSDFDIRNMRKDQITIYVCCNLSESRVYNLLISLLIQQIHDLNMRKRPSEDDKHSVLLLLDEFYYAGKMIDVLDKVSISAGYGFRMAIVVQSISQLDAIYGTHMRVLAVSSCDVKLIMKVSDDETAKQVSAGLGNRTETYKTSVIKSGGGIFGQKTYTPHYIERPLMTPAEVKELPEDTGILTVGNAPPFLFKKIRHYADAPYKKIWVEFLKKVPDVPALPAWHDKANLIVDETQPAAGATASSEPAPSSDHPSDAPQPVSAASARQVAPAAPVSAASEDTSAPMETITTANVRKAPAKPLSLTPPRPSYGETVSIAALSNGLADEVQPELVAASDAIRSTEASEGASAFIETVDAYGEDDPTAATLLRARRSEARGRLAVLPGSMAPGEVAGELPSPPIPVATDRLDVEAIRAKHAEGRKIVVMPPTETDGSGREDTFSGLAAAMERGSAKPRPRRTVAK